MAYLELFEVVPWTGSSEKCEVNITTGPPLPIFLNSDYEAIILGIDQRSYCYIQLTSKENQEQRENLQLAMSALYFTGKMQIPFEAMVVGDHLMFADANGIFHRVKIIQLTSNKEICCLDVDNNVFVKTTEEFLFMLTLDILSYPIQAIKCELYDLEILIGTDVLQGVFSSSPEAGICSCQFLLNKEIPSIILSMPGRPDLTAADIARKKLAEFCKLPWQIPDFTSVIVTHVNEDGFVWFQYDDPLVENIGRRTESFDPENCYLSEQTLREEVEEGLKNPDTIFIGRFKEVFYRAKVLSELKNGEITVDFIDYGNVETIPVEDLYPADLVDRNLQYIPPQCVKAHLYGIVVLRDLDTFWNKVESQEDIKVQVVEKGIMSEVNVFLDHNQRLNHILLESGAAFVFDYRPSVGEPTTLEIGSESFNSPSEVKIEDVIDHGDEDLGVTQAVNDELAAGQHSSYEVDSAIESNALSSDHSKDVVIEDQVDEVLEIGKQLPEVNEIPSLIPDFTSVIVTHVDEDGFVWFQYYDSLMETFSQRIENFDPDKCSVTEQVLRDKVEEGLKNKDTIFIGRFKGMFYRAKVLTEVKNGEITVDFIDYGNVETIRVEDLYPADVVDSNLQFIAPQCVKAHLYGIVVLQDLDAFWTKVESQEEIKVQVVEKGVIWEVNLFLDHNQRLNHILSESGAAFVLEERQPFEAPTTPKTESESCKSPSEVKIEDVIDHGDEDLGVTQAVNDEVAVGQHSSYEVDAPIESNALSSDHSKDVVIEEQVEEVLEFNGVNTEDVIEQEEDLVVVPAVNDDDEAAAEQSFKPNSVSGESFNFFSENSSEAPDADVESNGFSSDNFEDVVVEGPSNEAFELRNKLPEFCELPGSIPNFSSVIVTHVDEYGFVWFQYLNSLMVNISTETFDLENRYPTEKILCEEVGSGLQNKDTIFIGQFNEWFYRVKVLSEVKNGEVTVEFIDYGNIATIRVVDLYPADVVDRNLQFIPPQCVKAHLHGIVILSDVNAFWAKLGSQADIKVQVVRNGPMSEVNLFVEQNQCLNQILVESRAAFLFDIRHQNTVESNL